MITAKTFAELVREEHARLREANDCHTPAGSPQGGQFCSKGGGATGGPGAGTSMSGEVGGIKGLRFKLASAVTAYERRPVRGYNRYALAQYLGGVDRVIEKVQQGMSVDKAVEGEFSGPVLAWVKKAIAQPEDPNEKALRKLQRQGKR